LLTEFWVRRLTNQPTHAIVAKKNWLAHGNSAVAISHHWSEEKALQMARIEQHERNEEIVVVAFVDKAIAE
jgi:hypothetical protein